MNTKKLPRQVESKIQARFPDCDPFNHLNNSRYIDYIINAREDQLSKFYDFNISKIVKEYGITWVVAQTQISYIIPVDVMETVTIQSRLLSFNKRAILLEGIMWNENKTEVKSVMWSKQAHYNLKSKRSHQHSSELLKFFNEIQYPLEFNQTFEERVRSLRQVNQSI